jgi:hypothetical protein
MKAKFINENIGNGYATSGTYYGNPSQVSGNSFGFRSGTGFMSGNGTNQNSMYTYDVKSLNHTLEPQITQNPGEEEISVGSFVEGIVLNKVYKFKNKKSKGKIEGKIISIKKDEDGNILYYNVQNSKNNIVYKVDPTSVLIVKYQISRLKQEMFPMQKQEPTIGVDQLHSESFYPIFVNFLYEEELNSKNYDDKSAKEHLKSSKKISKEMKEKIAKYVNSSSKYKNGILYGLIKPEEFTNKTEKTSGVSFGADKNGFFCYTHRARSKSYKTPTSIPNKDINFIESTG